MYRLGLLDNFFFYSGCYGVLDVPHNKKAWRCTRCVRQQLAAVSKASVH